MERKHFLSMVGLGIAGMTIGKTLKMTFPEKSKVLIVFVGGYIPEAVYQYSNSLGFESCQILVNKKGNSKRKNMDNLILGNEITTYQYAEEKVNFYWVTPRTAELAARQNIKEIKELLCTGFSEIVFVANFDCSVSTGILKIILLCLPKTNVKVHSVTENSGVYDLEERRFQKFVLKCFSKNNFFCDITTSPYYNPRGSISEGNKLQEKMFLKEFKECIKNVGNEKR